MRQILGALCDLLRFGKLFMSPQMWVIDRIMCFLFFLKFHFGKNQSFSKSLSVYELTSIPCLQTSPISVKTRSRSV